MGQQYRSPRTGNTEPYHTVTRASSTVATVPTGCVALLSTVVGADFTLMPPEAGVKAHVIVSNLVTTKGIILRACPAGTTTITFTSTSADNVINFDVAGPHSVRLTGFNSTRWILDYRTIASTGAILGTS